MSAIQKLWLKSIIIGVFFFLLGASYLYIKKGIFNLYYANKVFAWTAFFLISISMGLSSIGYLFGRFKRVLSYRKYLGLVGFWAFVIHAAISMILLADEFSWPSYYYSSSQIWSTLASYLAAIILLAMIWASRDFMVKKLGVVVWRRILRLGYLVMVLVIIHFSLKHGWQWQQWWARGKQLLPPIGVVAIGFSIIIFLLRLVLEINIRKKSKDR